MSVNKKSKKITQDDVAQLAGVTRSMVSYVLNGSDRSVAPETREKILNAIDTLGYKPNKFAQGLLLGNEAFVRNKIGVILCNQDVFLRPYYTEMISGIFSSAHENNFHISFIRFFNELKNPILFNELISSEEIGGLILLSTNQCIFTENDRDIIKKIKSKINKIVCVEWEWEGLSSVSFDRKEAAYDATNYMFKKAYLDCAYIGENDERIEGFKEAYINNGFKSIEKLFIGIANDMSSGYSAAKILHNYVKQNKIKQLPRGICCGSDEVAIGVLKYLNSNKISIPSEVAVISIDNIEIAQYTNPPLTTINVQKKLMGVKAVEMIVNDCAKQDNEAIKLNLSTQIVERQST